MNVNMEEIFNHLPDVHVRILRNLFQKLNEEKDMEDRARIGCYIRGYVNCLNQERFINDNETVFLNHRTIGV